jgi:hypothetical protein
VKLVSGSGTYSATWLFHCAECSSSEEELQLRERFLAWIMCNASLVATQPVAFCNCLLSLIDAAPSAAVARTDTLPGRWWLEDDSSRAVEESLAGLVQGGSGLPPPVLAGRSSCWIEVIRSWCVACRALRCFAMAAGL